MKIRRDQTQPFQSAHVGSKSSPLDNEIQKISKRCLSQKNKPTINLSHHIVTKGLTQPSAPKNKKRA